MPILMGSTRSSAGTNACWYSLVLSYNDYYSEFSLADAVPLISVLWSPVKFSVCQSSLGPALQSFILSKTTTFLSSKKCRLCLHCCPVVPRASISLWILADLQGLWSFSETLCSNYLATWANCAACALHKRLFFLNFHFLEMSAYGILTYFLFFFFSVFFLV